MRKLTTTLTLLCSGLILAGTALAQQTAVPKKRTTPVPQTKKATGATAAKSQTQATAKAPEAMTEKEKISYALGMNVAASFRNQAVDTEIDPKVVAQSLVDSLTGQKTRLTDDEARAALTTLQASLRKKAADKAQQAGAANKAEGEAFLAANKTKEGIVTLPSGVQYKVLTAGTGPKPTASDTVVCNYRGTLINGKEFDSSYKRGQPATFPVNAVIKGWTEVLQLMPVGSKWQVFIPSEMAYGDRQAGPDIGPNSTLIFEIELISIEAPKLKTP